MVARSYILDTKAVQRNSPLVLAALMTTLVKKHLSTAGREDLCSMISTVTWFGDCVTIVTGRPMINFELRMYQGALSELIKKTLNQHGFSVDFHLNFR